MIGYLIHEPSLVLWWRAKQKLAANPGGGGGASGGARAIPGGHVWVLEDDTYFEGDVLPFFEHYHRHVTADLVSVFAPYHHDCLPEMRRGPWPAAAPASTVAADARGRGGGCYRSAETAWYRRMVKLTVLAVPQLATTGSSDCI